MGLPSAAGAAAKPVPNIAGFKGGVVIFSTAAMLGGTIGIVTFHDPLPPPPPAPPPPHPDPHPAPPPPPPPHPDPHPAPPPPPPPHPDPHPVPPPPTDPHHPPPPPSPAEQPAPSVPRDEIVSRTEPDDHQGGYGQIIDISQLSAGTDDLVDAGVTSGSDPAIWEPVEIDVQKNETCDSAAGSEPSKSEGTPPACGVGQR